MKYIDADLLRKEIKRLEKTAHKSALGCADSETRKFHEGKDYAYQHIGILIDSLQQEQHEVDLVAELKHHLATTPKEQLEKEWKELEPWGNIGPTVQEFLYGKQPEVNLDAEIEMEWDSFNKHIAKYSEGAEAVVWLNWNSFVDVASNFYELGKNSK